MSCKKSLDELIVLVESLGFKVNWDKVAQPAEIMTFLGVKLNCVERSLSLPDNKLSELKSLLNVWVTQSKVTKKELQRMIGKLCWCARVVRGGQTVYEKFDQFIAKGKGVFSLCSHYFCCKIRH